MVSTLLVLAAMASHAAAVWLHEGGDHYRHSSITVRSTAASGESSAVLYAPLGLHVFPAARISSATPVLTNQGLVLAFDDMNHLTAYEFPEHASPGTTGGPWRHKWKFGGCANPAPWMSLSTTPVINAEGIAYWVNKGTSQLCAVDTTRDPPMPPHWAPLNLTKAAQDHFGGDYFHPTREWAVDAGIIFYAGNVWVPGNDFHGAIIVDGARGNFTWTTGITAHNEHRLQGSVGTAGGDWRNVAFTDYQNTKGVQAFSPEGPLVWNGQASLSEHKGDFNHPVHVSFDSGAYHCVVTSEWSTRGLFISADGAKNGEACAAWAQQGYWLDSQWTTQPQWVSAAAVLPVGDRFRLFFGVNLPNTADGTVQSALVALLIGKEGLISATAPAEAFKIIGAHINAAPVVFRQAWGANDHAVAVTTGDGEVRIFPAVGFSSAGAKHKIDSRAALPPPAASANGVRAAAQGPYMAANPAGSVMFMAWNHASNEVYLVGVARALAGPAGAAAGSASGPTGGQVAGAIFGTLLCLGVVAAGIVFLAPSWSFTLGGKRVVPAESIRSGAGATYRAGAAAVHWVGVKTGLVKPRGAAVSSTTGFSASAFYTPTDGAAAPAAAASSSALAAGGSGSSERSGLLASARSTGGYGNV